MHQLLLPKLVKVTSGGIFVKEFCYTSGKHGGMCAKVLFRIENYKTCADFDRTAGKSV